MRRHRLYLGAIVAVLVAVAVLDPWSPLKTELTKPAERPSGRFNSENSVNAAFQSRVSKIKEDAGADIVVSRDPQGAFASFANWMVRYTNIALASRHADLEREGIALAHARREYFIDLIRSNPEEAIKQALAPELIEQFPPAIREHLEQHVSGRGALSVLAALPAIGNEAKIAPIFRTATINGKEYEAHVYGRRLGQPTRNNVPLRGIAVGSALAIHESPVRVLNGREAERYKPKAADAICGVSGLLATANNEPVVVDIGGEIRYLCGANHINAFVEQIVAAEGDGPTGGASAADVEASTWTEGLKKVILIRVDFSDLAGAPLSDTAGTNLVNDLHSFYNEMSYGRAGFYPIGSGSDITPTFRVATNAAWYGTNDYYNQLRSEARAAATAAGYNLNNYDRDVICMGAVPGFGWAGLAYVGAAGAWLRSSFNAGVAGHELGHNWGLNHASSWDTSGQSVIGPGTSAEYGDIFDTMGSASAGNNHFNARYKNYLNWLTASEVITATSNGTYRIFAHDAANASSIRGLRIVRDPATNYWVEFRQKFTGNKWLMNGAGLRWAQSGNQKSQLLDTTPGSPDGKNDSAIVIGRTFSDLPAGIHITPIGKGGTAPESLDVVVNLGTFPTNVPPTVTVSAPLTNAVTGVTLTFSASANDANGDTLAYYWDFGDGNFGTNGPAASKSWSSAGEYVVRCTVTDMKGGVASDSVIAVIGSPTTYRVSGTITTANGPLQGARVSGSSTRVTYTDSDGTYTLTGLPAGSYTVSAVLENYTFALAGFTNPVNVGPSQTNVDFFATYTLSPPPQITTQPASQTLTAGSTVTFSIAATGSTPLYYQWRFNGADIAGATATSYTRTNVQTNDAGTYSCTVSNAAGTATSAGAVLTINTAPRITAPPQSQTIIAGSNATFNVSASGTAPLYYQWRFNGTNIPGATASSCTRTNAQAADAGNYAVVVSNTAGSITSEPAALIVQFVMNVSATYGGRVTKNPDQPSYPLNSIVTLTAAPVSVFSFTGWSGGASGTNNPLMVVVTNTMNIVANFSSPVADLIVDNPQATFTGTWSTDTAAGDKYSTNYRTASSATTVSATSRFTPYISTAGWYDVYAWFPTISRGATAVPFLISSRRRYESQCESIHRQRRMAITRCGEDFRRRHERLRAYRQQRRIRNQKCGR